MKANLCDSLNTKKNQLSNRLICTGPASTSNRSSSNKMNYPSKRGISSDHQRESHNGYINSKYLNSPKNHEAPPSSGSESILILFIFFK